VAITTGSRISTALQQTASAALGLAVALGLAQVATPSAQAQTYTETVLHSFTLPPDGANPTAGLVRDAKGNLYGTTYRGGASSSGTVFKVDPTGEETLLYTFSGGADGKHPNAGLVRDAAGNFYGTTSSGGASGIGTVFKLSKTGKETVLHSFAGYPTDGASPYAGLILDGAGNLYGTTTSGGASDEGTVFKLDSSGQESVLYSFRGDPDGANPFAALVQDAAGNLYGTTFYGGTYERCGGYGCGTVFELKASGKEEVLFDFTSMEGSWPYSNLVLDSAILYGTTEAGGDEGYGTAFSLKAGVVTVLHSFTGAGGDGESPYAGLIRDAKGNLYGTTSRGGAFGDGMAFKLDKSGNETVLYSFTGLPDGAYPLAGLIRDAKGNLYGTTEGGDPWRGGVVFELSP
jgi:uncharacterized repeat protein (TIGR03803 family)